MPPISPPPDLPTHAFPTAASFDAFLEREHASAPGIYLKLAKKASGIPSITGAEAVETALCYGWIDGRANGIDDKWWTVRYTPRRAKSIWSQKNVGTVAGLIEEGRMRPAGLAAIEAAKADGRWDRAYAGPATMVTPADFTEALATEPSAKAYFESLNKTQRYQVLIPLATISDKNRAKKIQALAQSLAVGARPGVLKKAKESSQTKGGRFTKVAKVHTTTKRTTVTSIPRTIDDLKAQPRREGLRRRA
ncbi:hypothetical protein CC86DRAFT_291943 [Ophiobolus disseminans]|uniref:Uncharacterized protein n=1 Tax=Ophiobolus disseminans TaxID=1469910 RepID=A0A6A7A1V8_9PLEO|nr:hypothetical protein CC86DRAFT_291943 [Ophiobolus disseminans]